MIYLIGGAARVGKSTLANLLLTRRCISVLATDTLVHTLKNVAPQLGVTDRGPLREKAEKLFPYLEGLIRYNSFPVEHFCLEGEQILPEHAVRLAAKYPIRSCFLGMSHTTIARLRNYAGPDSWVHYLSEERWQRLPTDVIDQSAFVKAECDKFRMPYFDLSRDYPETLEAACQHLLSDSKRLAKR